MRNGSISRPTPTGLPAYRLLGVVLKTLSSVIVYTVWVGSWEEEDYQCSKPFPFIAWIMEPILLLPRQQSRGNT